MLKIKKENIDYRQGYIDGIKDSQKNVTKEIIDLIENGFVDSLDALKKILLKIR